MYVTELFDASSKTQTSELLAAAAAAHHNQIHVIAGSALSTTFQMCRQNSPHKGSSSSRREEEPARFPMPQAAQSSAPDACWSFLNWLPVWLQTRYPAKVCVVKSATLCAGS